MKDNTTERVAQWLREFADDLEKNKTVMSLNTNVDNHYIPYKKWPPVVSHETIKIEITYTPGTVVK